MLQTLLQHEIEAGLTIVFEPPDDQKHSTVRFLDLAEITHHSVTKFILGLVDGNKPALPAWPSRWVSYAQSKSRDGLHRGARTRDLVPRCTPKRPPFERINPISTAMLTARVSFRTPTPKSLATGWWGVTFMLPNGWSTTGLGPQPLTHFRGKNSCTTCVSSRGVDKYRAAS